MGYTIWPDGEVGDVLQDVFRERMRQEELKRQGKFKHTCADVMPNAERLAVLAEEFGEVSRHVCEELIAERLDTAERLKLHAELVQVAAVAVAWAEALRKGEST